jgi:hypothetical protein
LIGRARRMRRSTGEHCLRVAGRLRRLRVSYGAEHYPTSRRPLRVCRGTLSRQRESGTLSRQRERMLTRSWGVCRAQAVSPAPIQAGRGGEGRAERRPVDSAALVPTFPSQCSAIMTKQGRVCCVPLTPRTKGRGESNVSVERTLLRRGLRLKRVCRAVSVS